MQIYDTDLPSQSNEKRQETIIKIGNFGKGAVGSTLFFHKILLLLIITNKYKKNLHKIKYPAIHIQ